MLWSNVKGWAKKNGYSSFRDKTNGQDNQYDYYWGKTDDPAVTGCCISVSNLAKDIYNHITDNKFIEHQKEYKESLSAKDIQHGSGL